MNLTRRTLSMSALAFVALASTPALALDRHKLTRKARESLNELLASSPAARRACKSAHAVLVFPSFRKGGSLFGADTAAGVRSEGAKPVGFYSLSGGSWGLQIGGQD